MSFASLLAGIALFIGIGIPLTAYVWETLNLLLAGAGVTMGRALLTLPALVLLIALLRLLARTVERWDGTHRPEPLERRPHDTR